MHSSRMRTVRSSSHLPPGGGEPGPGGCAWSRVVPGPRGGRCLVWGVGVPGPGGVPSPGGVPGPVGCLVPGGAWSQGGVIPACTEADTPRGQTDRCKNITFATSLRTVKNSNHCDVGFIQNTHSVAVALSK